MTTTKKPVFCLLTDFGLHDHYVGTMKGVLLSHSPEAQIVDINHNVEPQNVHAAAYELLSSHSYQPAGAIFICVVDPGVGTERSILLAHAGSWWFVAPDNGLLSWVFDLHKSLEIYRVAVDPSASHTFHGRDVIAPIAARLAQGEPASSLGERVATWIKIPFPIVLKNGAMWQGEVIAIDDFGNLITNVKSDELRPYANASKLWIEFDDSATTIRGLSTSYADVDIGKLCALEGSSGFIEIAANQEDAADITGLLVGDRITFHFRT
jgi:S-adenosylmethionine hydrolase